MLINYRRLAWMIVGLAFFSGRSSAQTCVTPPSGMIAWWTLDETSGIIANDSVGTEPAAYFGTPGPVQVPGEVAGALQFNGSTDFLSAPNSPLWQFGSNDFTVELWANFAAPPGGSLGDYGDVFIGDDDGPGSRNKWFFAVSGGLLHFTVYNTADPPPNYYLAQAPFAPVLGQWYHLAVTKEGTNYTIYVKGQEVSSEVSTQPIGNPTASLTIGQAENFFMNGLLDEISIYNRALSPSELQAIVAAGSAGKCKLPNASAISPSSGGNSGAVTVTVTGAEFTPATTVSLQMTGEPSLEGTNTYASSDGTSLIHQGVPPALPGRQQEFDIFGSPSKKLQEVSRQAHIKENLDGRV